MSLSKRSNRFRSYDLLVMSQARFLCATLRLHEVGFEPTKPKHKILSLAHLTALVLVLALRLLLNVGSFSENRSHENALP